VQPLPDSSVSSESWAIRWIPGAISSRSAACRARDRGPGRDEAVTSG